MGATGWEQDCPRGMGQPRHPEMKSSRAAPVGSERVCAYVAAVRSVPARQRGGPLAGARARGCARVVRTWLRVFTLTCITLGISEHSGYSVGPRGAAGWALRVRQDLAGAARTQQRWGPPRLCPVWWCGVLARHSGFWLLSKVYNTGMPWEEKQEKAWLVGAGGNRLAMELEVNGFAHPYVEQRGVHPLLAALQRGTRSVFPTEHEGRVAVERSLLPLCYTCPAPLSLEEGSQGPGCPQPGPGPCRTALGRCRAWSCGQIPPHCSQPCTNLPTTTSPSTMAPSSSIIFLLANSTQKPL